MINNQPCQVQYTYKYSDASLQPQYRIGEVDKTILHGGSFGSNIIGPRLDGASGKPRQQ